LRWIGIISAILKNLSSVDGVGAVDADADRLLEQCFEDHEAYLESKAPKKFLILGRKGSGETAIYRKLLRDRAYNRFSFGHDFTDYPWHHHQLQSVTHLESKVPPSVSNE
jgi:hypothetical protein